MDANNQGVYIELLHGRKTPDEVMDDFGPDGPVFGPFEWVHTTYGCDIKLGDDGELQDKDGLVYYDGMWYGDWSVFSHKQLLNGLEHRHKTFCQKCARFINGEISECYHR